jgi:flagellar biosynthesis protein FlhF
MRLKLYRARSVTEAMAQVRAELGADALILSTRRTAGGVELTAALEPADDARPPAPVAQPAGHTASLIWHGLPAEVAARLAVGKLAETLPTLLRFEALPLTEAGPPLLLVGPPGAGKTLTTARLATRLVLAGIRPLVITADGRRAGAAEELAAYTRLLGISLVVASHPATLARALQHRAEGTPVLIDTTGASPFDPGDVEALAALAATAAATPVLVLPAGQDPHEAADQACSFAEAGARHLLPTRLDLARRLGGIVTAAAAGSLALTEAGTGPGASDGLTNLTAEFLAHRLSRITPNPS